MVVHWRRALARGDAGASHRVHLCINAAGAIMTAAALAVIVVAKWTNGAWITVLVVPAVIVLLRAIRRYYGELERQVRTTRPLRVGATSAPVVLVTTEGWSKLTAEALNFALSLS